MKKLVSLLVVSAAALSFNVAMAHGTKAQHGGIVATAQDLGFELTNEGDKATLYITDHGQPFDTAGLSGKLTVLSGTEKSEVELKPAGENKLEAQGVKLAKGSKAVATLTNAEKKTLTVRFSVK
ncbi:hypothetical protein [Caldimonas brevitalea]|uniref:Uncharacterized protein n=1 Tax=Caldimonas brevitalea TaxID=413882 RepID=A0A0G3BJ90_9BURK|nr:hypothetical protein [Caldimonas brevitalea]AKJ29442.1 hypothetical protein AAW51_2751 [Caldimonas brevitalea]